MSEAIERVGVVGAGLMGAGIAEVVGQGRASTWSSATSTTPPSPRAARASSRRSSAR